jgi:vancomycin permeability regulator SanA
MGFRKPMDYNSVHHQIIMTGVELNSPRNDGFVAFEMKKDLLRLKFLLDQILQDSPEFVGESEFLQEQSKKQMWRALNEV